LTRPEAPFEEPWQAQAFALAVQLSAAGVFTWPDWSAALGRELAADPQRPYFESWLAALESLTLARGLTAARELAARKSAWEATYLRTPHGQPVEL
jgi:nitrile hydratase accessory protein